MNQDRDYDETYDETYDELLDRGRRLLHRELYAAGGQRLSTFVHKLRLFDLLIGIGRKDGYTAEGREAMTKNAEELEGLCEYYEQKS